MSVIQPIDPQDDARYMQRALELAREAQAVDEVPVGAVVVRGGEIIGEGFNAPIGRHDPSAHAEIVALRDAARRCGNYRLPGATLYVTIEPCAMCAGALVHARIARVVFAAREPRAGVVVSNIGLLAQPFLNHRVEWEEGLCRDEAARMIGEFFRRRRGG